jgi:hypothetical protein
MLFLSEPGAGGARSSSRLRTMLTLIEQQDSSPFELTDEQLAEMRRRRADTKAKLLAREGLDARLSRSSQ